MTKSRKKTSLPMRQQILNVLQAHNSPLKKSQIAKILDIKGDQRYEFKQVLDEMIRYGEVDRGDRRRIMLPNAPVEDKQSPSKARKSPTRTSALKSDLLISAEIIEEDEDGELYARPIEWEPKEGDTSPPRIHLVRIRSTLKKGGGYLTHGTRLIVKVTKKEGGEWEGEVVRRLLKDSSIHVGVYRPSHHGRANAGTLSPLNRKDHFAGAHIRHEDAQDLEEGDIVQYHMEHSGRIKIMKRLGKFEDPHMFSEIAIHTHNLPHEFSSEAVEEAEKGRIPPLGNRTDFRGLDLVTIDGEDARDFDDAVWAKSDEDPRNEGGWRVLVAIADVSYYVRIGGRLDKEAKIRGNSVYFPDRVVPMLPEALSNEMCSLKPNVDRACMAIEMIIGAQGKLKSYRVKRGLMCSRARLTYNQVQEAIDGKPDQLTKPLLESVIKPLYGVYKSLLKARNQRGTLDLDVPERQIIFNSDGKIKEIVRRERFDSHKLIEELMIAANVAAAKTLTAKNWPCLYRVHDRPEPTRLENLSQFLKPYRLKVQRFSNPDPGQFNILLNAVKGKPFEDSVNQMVLRSQCQARYSPENLGHFGLNLTHYAHFTSPIRRYADLVIHRSLIGALKLGDDGYSSPPDNLVEVGDHISTRERAAVTAEREVVDRFAISYVAEHVGADFDVIITGLNRFGLFVSLKESGAEGFIPKGSLGGGFGEAFTYDERNIQMVSKRLGISYRLGDKIRATLTEATPQTNTLIFRTLDVGKRSNKGFSSERKPSRSKSKSRRK